jgi:hypothetical protein
MDRDIYDRNWFHYTVVYRQHEKPIQHSINEMDHGEISHHHHAGSGSSDQLREYKVLEINKFGDLVEKQTFIHPYQRNEDQHLYFSQDFTRMIELNISKVVRQ